MFQSCIAYLVFVTLNIRMTFFLFFSWHGLALHGMAQNRDSLYSVNALYIRVCISTEYSEHRFEAISSHICLTFCKVYLYQAQHGIVWHGMAWYSHPRLGPLPQLCQSDPPGLQGTPPQLPQDPCVQDYLEGREVQDSLVQHSLVQHL